MPPETPYRIRRRRFLHGTALLAALPAGVLRAQTRSTVLTLIVPFAAGGTSDALARIVGESIGKALGEAAVVDNRPGGSTTIGTLAALKAPADGHTLLLNTASSVVNPSLMPHLSYELRKDLLPVSLLASNPHILVVNPSVPANDLASLVQWAKQKKGGASYASFGNGSSGHLGFELLKMDTGIPMLHVPYKGVAPATNDLLGGQVDAMLSDLAQVVPYVKDGKLKAIAISGDARSPLLPDVPTFAQSGLPGFKSSSWFGMLVRSGTPAPVVARLSTVVMAALADPAVREKLARIGMDPVGSPPAAFATFMDAEAQKYARVIQFAGVKID